MLKVHMISPTSSRWVRLLAAALMGFALVVVSGCGDRGAAEKAGEKVDEAVEETKDFVDPDGPAEEAGEKVDEAVEGVTE